MERAGQWWSGMEGKHATETRLRAASARAGVMPMLCSFGGGGQGGPDEDSGGKATQTIPQQADQPYTILLTGPFAFLLAGTGSHMNYKSSKYLMTATGSVGKWLFLRLLDVSVPGKSL